MFGSPKKKPTVKHVEVSTERLKRHVVKVTVSGSPKKPKRGEWSTRAGIRYRKSPVSSFRKFKYKSNLIKAIIDIKCGEEPPPVPPRIETTEHDKLICRKKRLRRIRLKNKYLQMEIDKLELLLESLKDNDDGETGVVTN
jgi:hypothetical protein